MADDTVKPESDDSAKPEAEDESQDELDSLLKDWDESEKETEKKKPPPKESPRSDPMVEELYRRTMEEDLSKTVDQVYSNLEDLPARPNKTVIRHYLEGRAMQDEGLTSAWTQRHRNPDKWGKVVDLLTSEFKKAFEVKEEESSTSEMESAAAYVRGSSTKPDSEPPVTAEKLAKMSDSEFNEFWSKHKTR